MMDDTGCTVRCAGLETNSDNLICLIQEMKPLKLAPGIRPS